MIDSRPSTAAYGDAAEEIPGELVHIALTSLTRRTQSVPLPLPIPSPTSLPAHLLDPEMLERLVAELVSRRGDNTVQFYGRRGQKQHGLDIVELRRGDRTLYQVKRYQELTATQIKAAIEEYAGPPRKPGHREQPRRFDPARFVLVTSAELDRDTANVDAVADLQDEYLGDLEIEVWGIEALSRDLRDAPRLVHAIFGEAWAKAFCGYDPSAQAAGAPQPLGLVNSPVEVLGLDVLEAEAQTAVADDPHLAANLFGLVAQALVDSNFPGHAVAVRRRQADCLLAAGDRDGAFSLRFALGLERALAGEDFARSSLQAELLQAQGTLHPVQEAKLRVLVEVADWPDVGSDLSSTVPALQALAAANDPDTAVLCCLVIEQALVDGLYDFEEPTSLVAETDDSTADLLRELRGLALAAAPADPLLRVRLRCAAADATLRLSAPATEVETAYAQLIDDAAAGRFVRGRGLVLSRAAYAFGVRGETARADSLWRQSVLMNSEDGYYGDARAALRAAQRLVSDSGVLPRDDGLVAVFRAMPNRRRVLGRANDPSLSALWAAHADRLIEAFGDARRYIWESRMSGHLQEEFLALGLFGDVLASAGRPQAAVHLYVAAGDAKRAVTAARALPQPVSDPWRWTGSQLRRRRAAALRVIGSQAATVPDEEVDQAVSRLLGLAQGLWEARAWNPCPELDALKAVASFGVRIPESAVDGLLALATPALAEPTHANDEIGRVLVQAYWANEPRRTDLAAGIGSMLALPNSDRLWGLVRNVPPAARGPLLPQVQGLADKGSRQAVEVLARWGVSSAAVQVAARGACAAFLRRAVGLERTWTAVGTQESETVSLLLALLDAPEPVDVPASELGPDKAQAAGGILMVTSFKPGTVDGTVVEGATGAREDQQETDPSRTSVTAPDEATVLASGPRGELAAAVGLHLMAIVEDTHDGGDSRSQALSALRLLLRRLTPEFNRDIVPRLLSVGRFPNLTEADQAEIEMDQPLSRMRYKSPARWLGPLAHAAAAEAFATGRSYDKATEPTEVESAQHLTAEAARLLRATDPETRMLGAIILDALAAASAEFDHLSAPLLFHPDEGVRAVGAARASCTPDLLLALAQDPSSKVRTAIASRAADLPEAARAALAADPDLAVRRTVTLRLEKDRPSSSAADKEDEATSTGP